MSIEKQEILKWIPVVNIVVIAICWMKTYAKNVTTNTRFIKNLLKMFLVLIVFNVPRAVLYAFQLSDVIYDIAFYVSLYLSLFFISVIAIKDQNRFIEEKKQ